MMAEMQDLTAAVKDLLNDDEEFLELQEAVSKPAPANSSSPDPAPSAEDAMQGMHAQPNIHTYCSSKQLQHPSGARSQQAESASTRSRPGQLKPVHASSHDDAVKAYTAANSPSKAKSRPLTSCRPLSGWTTNSRPSSSAPLHHTAVSYSHATRQLLQRIAHTERQLADLKAAAANHTTDQNSLHGSSGMPDVLHLTCDLCILYNQAAQQLLNQEALPAAFNLVKKAQALLDKWDEQCKLQYSCTPSSSQSAGTAQQQQQGACSTGSSTWSKHTLQAYTFNTRAQYHCQAKAPQAALAALRQAEQLEQQHHEIMAQERNAAEDSQQQQQHHHHQALHHHPATTQLNMCAVLGSMKRYEQALACAEQALILLGAYGATPPHRDMWDLIAVALYNRAAQLEHLDRLADALEDYQAAADQAANNMLPGSSTAAASRQMAELIKLVAKAQKDIRNRLRQSAAALPTPRPATAPCAHQRPGSQGSNPAGGLWGCEPAPPTTKCTVKQPAAVIRTTTPPHSNCMQPIPDAVSHAHGCSTWHTGGGYVESVEALAMRRRQQLLAMLVRDTCMH